MAVRCIDVVHWYYVGYMFLECCLDTFKDGRLGCMHSNGGMKGDVGVSV